MSKQLYEIGDQPPLGEVPEKMHAWVVREERFGDPVKAFQKEVVDVPAIADDEVLVYGTGPLAVQALRHVDLGSARQ